MSIESWFSHFGWKEEDGENSLWLRVISLAISETKPFLQNSGLTSTPLK